MIEALDPMRLPPARRADMIHRAAMAEVQQRLWQAAIGHSDESPDPFRASGPAQRDMDFTSLVALVSRNAPRIEAEPMLTPAQGRAAMVASARAHASPIASDALNLGANAGYAPALQSAAQRTGVPETALAAIVDAEAAKDSSGSWNVHSRNPRSSAAGLGQFLSGTWQQMARQPGTWLHEQANARGWRDSRGQIKASARSDLLRLRYDAVASIETLADYARTNIAHLERNGVTIGGDATSIARKAYLAHHLGPGDAVRFLTTGLSDSRAATLLAAQIGGGKARQAIAQAGDASAAHRAWLSGYVSRSVQPQRYA